MPSSRIPPPAQAWAGACLLALAASCECGARDGAVDPDSVPIGGWYRAEIEADDGARVPFYVALPADYQTDPATLRNGDEEVAAAHQWDGLRVEVEFPVYRSRIEAEAGEDGHLSGVFINESLAFGDSELPLSAEPVAAPDPAARTDLGQDPRSADARAAVDTEASELPERWRLTFDDTGEAELALSVTRRGAAEGVLRLENGNAIYLAGAARQDALRLSSFDGSSPYLLDLEIGGERAEGTWIAGPALGWREPVTGAATDPSFELEVDVSLAGPSTRLPVRELREAPYAGAPVVLALTGTWSPASGRAIPFLTELYEEHRDADLQVLALNYELTEDEGYNDAAAELLADEFDVPWEIIAVDGRAEDYAFIVPAGLENTDIQGFPILAFIDRRGSVRALRAGFPPAAASALRAEIEADYRDLAASIAAATE